jgi:hypothetical protein
VKENRVAAKEHKEEQSEAEISQEQTESTETGKVFDRMAGKTGWGSG